MELNGKGKTPVMHFGMTGMLQVRGELPVHYRETPRKVSTDWPPRFMKFVMHVEPEDSTPSTTNVCTEIAFLDARRLGRIRLVSGSPLESPPISNLGFDPVLSMPDLPTFSSLLLKRSCPIKALLLDQSFSAGVGNWVADEVLYHARVHPEQRCRTLSEEQVGSVWKWTSEVCRIAVDVNADDGKFPANWLFKHRWGKGKGKKGEAAEALELPSGEPATIKWVTVGGRTSAYVAELQQLPRSPTVKDEILEDDEPNESDLTPISESDTEIVVKTIGKRKASTATENKQTKPKRTARSKAADNATDDKKSVTRSRGVRAKTKK